MLNTTNKTRSSREVRVISLFELLLVRIVKINEKSHNISPTILDEKFNSCNSDRQEGIDRNRN